MIDKPMAGIVTFEIAAPLMLLCCLAIIVRWVRRSSPQSRSTEPYMDKQTLRSFAQVAGSLTAMIALVHVIGVYGSVPLFLFYYVRFLGGHRGLTTGIIALTTPVVTFLFFEIALNITLPKGLPVIEEKIFYPLFDILL